MKLYLHNFLSRERITNFATLFASPKIAGMKVTQKAFVKCLSTIYGFRSQEAYLDHVSKLHAHAYDVTTKQVFFTRTSDNKYKLAGIHLSIKVNGDHFENIHIHDGVLGDDGYLTKAEVRISIGMESSERTISISDRMRDSQIAINYAFEIVNWVNENIKKLQPKDFDGWSLNIFDQYKSNEQEIIESISNCKGIPTNAYLQTKDSKGSEYTSLRGIILSELNHDIDKLSHEGQLELIYSFSPIKPMSPWVSRFGKDFFKGTSKYLVIEKALSLFEDVTTNDSKMPSVILCKYAEEYRLRLDVGFDDSDYSHLEAHLYLVGEDGEVVLNLGDVSDFTSQEADISGQIAEVVMEVVKTGLAPNTVRKDIARYL
ncbi:hypothetical protein [Vibrio sp. D431a]|uniref:hypothetical protein n=1 Tax=Vibrio sp. D431a TaxID=2837388 RepID=UPI0025553A98|nr:hypothetical protein [Vibrio sp. D431a]MDK9789895.1 hypothetical protein [Vibrio sp. D431a]